MTIDDDAEVERLLDGLPSPLAFRALCAAVGRAGGSADLVERCAERLAHWPDETREAPWSWLAALAAGIVRPTWPLVRSSTLRSPANGTVDLALPDPRATPELRGTTHLDLARFAHEQLDALSRTADDWPDLRSVRTGHLTRFDGERRRGPARLARARGRRGILVALRDPAVPATSPAAVAAAARGPASP